MIKLILFIFTIAGCLQAQATQRKSLPLKEISCWEREINPRTERPYKNIEEWNHEKWQWQKQWTGYIPSVTEWAKVLQVMKAEESTLGKIRSDKVKHCFMGCRISATVNIETAYYMAWEKENVDLSDCKRSTHFEYRDYEATILGADYARQGKNDSQSCSHFCNSNFER